MDAFKVIIVEDVKLELKGTEQIFHSEIPEAEIIGTAATEAEFWKLMRGEVPHLVLLDLGLGGSTTGRSGYMPPTEEPLSLSACPCLHGRSAQRAPLGGSSLGWSRWYHPQDRQSA